ncbi:methylated-DNA--[protein]-cysteine S-methyltransferase [Dyella monticola]|uniref:Methylated-DNA--protein-cysteine methyltransferase n=1 Tax=Dyella monticola TaxID=1927958 RepID=A0A370WV16_9GAMM|nr:methylated-DNA--[protein]-cysteine S-methyltransferase [Dyella monticola]RDS79815.1 methylated-DNA--[protein]-cysteine S-methyltransferase [Dyella monticola]
MTTSNDIIWYDHMSTPIGSLLLAADASGLREVWFETGKHRRAPDPAWKHDPSKLTFARTQLDEYFAGTRKHFKLPLHPLGTSFQVTVWQALAKIPYGTTISYGELARRIGQPQAMRAVGAANGRNPLPIVLPCHRVIGSNGSLTGFGGGLPTKRFLLAMEDRVARGDLFGDCNALPLA